VLRHDELIVNANEKGGVIRSSAHIIEKQGKIGSGYRSV